MTDSVDYVWYACYGSNINKQRFMLYIEGGQGNIEGTLLDEDGARDKSPPIEERAIEIPYSLYFAKQSTRWGGGCAFLNSHTKLNKNDPKHADQITLGKMYLVTRLQFIDIMNQENCTKFNESDMNKAINRVSKETTQQLVINHQSWYGNLLLLGHAARSGENDVEYPILTFTSPIYFTPLKKPSMSYIRAIYKGVEDLYKDYNIEDYVRYFLAKQGIKDLHTREQIKKMLLTESATTAKN